MKLPTSRKESRQLIGVVNYYRNVWARILHKLAPLTTIMSSKVKFEWAKIEQDSFDEINRIVAHNTLLYYMDFNKGFKIHTDAINLQLGVFINP